MKRTPQTVTKERTNGISGEMNLAMLRLREKTPVYLHSQTAFPHSVLNAGHMGDEEAQPSKLLTVSCVHILNSFLSIS